MRIEAVRTHPLVEVACDDGTVGWGECLGLARLNRAVVEAYAPLLLGRDPLATEPLWALLYEAFRDQGQRGVVVTALSGLDVALWDVKDRRLGVPVSTLLGRRVRDRVRAYATGSFRTAGVDRAEACAAEAAGYAAEGFHAVKVKVGFDPSQDLRVIRAVREAIGPNVRLMIDASHGYAPDEAVAVGREAAMLGVDWFEEPVVPEDPRTWEPTAPCARASPSPSRAARPGTRGGAFARRSRRGAWTWCSPTSAGWAASPRRTAWPTSRPSTTSAWSPTSGARAWPSRRRSSS